MAIWSVASIADQPGIALVAWSVHEVKSELWEETTRHLVGWCRENHEGRVSSAIVTWNILTMICTTQSGRRYQLLGGPGRHSDAEHTWEGWKRRNQITQDRDVTEECVGQA